MVVKYSFFISYDALDPPGNEHSCSLLDVDYGHQCSLAVKLATFSGVQLATMDWTQMTVKPVPVSSSLKLFRSSYIIVSD